MDTIEPGQKAKQLFDKYKYAILVLAVGMLLMLLPEGSAEKEPVQTQAAAPVEASMEEHLESILAQIDGAGQVAVLLSQAEGEEILYQTDTRSDSQEGSSSEQSDTVIVNDSQRNEVGLIRRTDPPKYLGAVIVCQGADRAQVRLAVVEAVQCATGLGANQISVVKMK